MTVDRILYEYIRDNLVYAGDFRYGSAEGSSVPYIIMYKVTDPERPDTLCVEQGEQGQAMFQFSAYTEGGPGYMVEYLNDFKEQVKAIIGEVGTGADVVEIWYNNTGGVRLLSDGASEETIWGAFFETEIYWRYV